MKAGVYSRVSTPGQEDGMSLELQEQASVAMALSQGYEVPEEFRWREVWSGADLYRPVFDQVRAAAARGDIGALFLYHHNRLGRDPLHNSMAYAELRSTGVEVQFVEGNMEDTPEGRLLLYVQGYASQQERRLFAQRSMDNKAAIAKSGRLPVGCGAGLFGYDYLRNTKERVVNESEAAVVRLAFALALGGMNDFQIAQKLNEMGFRTKRGAKWEHRTVSRMVANESYVGVDYYGRHRWRRLEGNVREVTPRPEEEVIRIEGFTPPIISRAVFDSVQERKCEPRPRATPSKKAYLLTSFSRCMSCGLPVVGACLNRKWRYYRCRGTVPTASRPATCNERYIPADAYEEAVWGLVSEVVRDPAVIVSELHSRFESGSGNTAAEKARLVREVQELGREQARLLGLRQKDKEGLIDEEILLSQLAPVKALSDEKRRALAELEEQESARDDAALMERRIVEVCEKVSSKLETLDFDGKRELLGAFRAKVHATRDEFRVVLEVSPELTTTGQTLASPRERSRRCRWV